MQNYTSIVRYNLLYSAGPWTDWMHPTEILILDQLNTQLPSHYLCLLDIPFITAGFPSVYYTQISLMALWSVHHWWPEMKWWTDIEGSWPSPVAAESSAHRAGEPDDSDLLVSKLTDRLVSSLIGFEV